MNNNLEILLGIFMLICGIIPDVIVFVFITKFITTILKRKSNQNYFKNNVIKIETNIKPKDEYKDVTKEELLSTFNTNDINTLKNYLYTKFLDFEIAYNDLNYNTMKIVSTKQLFQTYYTGITLELKAGKKKIIENIKKNNMIIYEVFSSTAKQVVSSIIEISYINYTIDKNGYIINGDKSNTITEKFEVIFRKDYEKKDVLKCPNCGATILGNRCDFCRSIIKNIDFKISSIKKIVDIEKK